MKKNEVVIGGRYLAKVSGRVVPVRITGESRYGGWDAVNVETNRAVRIKSPQRLRRPADAATRQSIAGEETDMSKTRKTAAKGTSKVAGEPKPRKKAERKDGTMSVLDAAAKVLADAGEPLNCKTIVERAVEKGYWKTGGKTPSATVYAAILRDIQKKGDASRFAKTDRGRFTLKP